MQSKKENSKPRQGKKNSPPTPSGQASDEPEYVNYVLKLICSPASMNMSVTKEDRSKYPIVTTEAYVPKTAFLAATATIKNTEYSFPKDFDVDYTFHEELNEETGNGFELIKEKLYFKNLPGHPTLIGLAEEKNSGVPSDWQPGQPPPSNYENFGNFQLRGTGIFAKVEGEGIAMMGSSTGFVVYHVALIKGWPL